MHTYEHYTNSESNYQVKFKSTKDWHREFDKQTNTNFKKFMCFTQNSLVIQRCLLIVPDRLGEEFLCISTAFQKIKLQSEVCIKSPTSLPFIWTNTNHTCIIKP